jgi:hypothetical protein
VGNNSSFQRSTRGAALLLSLVLCGLAVASPAAAQPLRFGDRVFLRSSYSRYLVAEPEGILNANRAEGHEWERFTLVDPNNPQSTLPVAFGNLIALRSYHGKFVVAGDEGETAVDRPAIGPWERWRVENPAVSASTEKVRFGERIALESFHSLYLVALADGRTRADRNAIGAEEQWEVRQANAWTDYYYDDADPCGAGCCNCPRRGRYDGANCFVAKAPANSNPFILDNNFFYSAGPSNSCPLGSFDGAHCRVGTNPGGTTPFIYQGGFYLVTACSAVTGVVCLQQRVGAWGDHTSSPCSAATQSLAESKARDNWHFSVANQFGDAYATFASGSNPTVNCQQFNSPGLGCTATCLASATPCKKCSWQYSELDGAATNAAGDVAIDSTGKVFYRSSQGVLNAIYWQNGKWNFSDLNRAATDVASNSGLVIDSTGKVFYRSVQGVLNAIYYQNGRWNFSDLNRAATDVASNSNFVIDSTGKVFYRSVRGVLNAIYYQNGRWNFSDLNRAATDVAGDLAIDSTGKVFYRSVRGVLNAIYYQNGRWNFSDLNRAATDVAGGLAVDSTGKAFYRSSQGVLNAIYYQNGRWNFSDLNRAATDVAGDSNLVIDSTGKVFYRSSRGVLNAIYWQNGKWNFSDLNRASTNAAGSLAADDRGKVFYLDSSGRVDAIYWDCGR